MAPTRLTLSSPSVASTAIAGADSEMKCLASSPAETIADPVFDADHADLVGANDLADADLGIVDYGVNGDDQHSDLGDVDHGDCALNGAGDNGGESNR